MSSACVRTAAPLKRFTNATAFVLVWGPPSTALLCFLFNHFFHYLIGMIRSFSFYSNNMLIIPKLFMWFDYLLEIGKQLECV